MLDPPWAVKALSGARASPLPPLTLGPLGVKPAVGGRARGAALVKVVEPRRVVLEALVNLALWRALALKRGRHGLAGPRGRRPGAAVVVWRAGAGCGVGAGWHGAVGCLGARGAGHS